MVVAVGLTDDSLDWTKKISSKPKSLFYHSLSKYKTVRRLNGKLKRNISAASQNNKSFFYSNIFFCS